MGAVAQMVGTGAPGAPANFAIDGSPTSTGGDFIWDIPTNTGTLPIDGYYFYARTPQGAGAYSIVATPSSNGTTIDDTFTPATAYDLYVTAVNGRGESAPSNVIQITTAA